MGLNFRKSISIFPGVKLNLSKSGVGISTGVKGARVSLNSKGQARTTLGIPGSGVYYTKQVSAKKVAKEMSEKISGKGKNEEAKSSSKKASNTASETPVAAEKKVSKNAIDEEIIEANRTQVADHEEYVEAIKSVHKQSDGSIDWNALASGNVPSDIVKGSEEHKQWQALAEYAEKVLEGDIDTYLEIISEVEPFDDILDFGSNFQVGTDRKDFLEVEFGVKSDDVVPKYSYALKANGEITEKELSKTAYCDLVQDYVCSTTIRVARDAFALLPVDTVIVHAVDNVINTATGHEEEVTLLSVKFNREQLMSLNMALIDPSDAIGGFENKMKFKKTEGFQQVDRLTAD